MTRHKPYNPAEIDYAPFVSQNRNIAYEVIEIADPESPGKLIKRKQGKRLENVFEALYKSGSINAEERSAANHLIEFYARSIGQIGVGEKRDVFVDCSTEDPHRDAFIRARYGIKFNDVLARLAQNHEKLLKALIYDFVTGDGSSGTDEVRWRKVVTLVTGVKNRNFVVDKVSACVSDLPQAMIDHRKDEERNHPRGILF